MTKEESASRNKLFLPETTCHHGSTVMGLRQGGGQSLASQPFPNSAGHIKCPQ
jgi:hypothetical protein